jgi:hypothetical protein
MSLTMLAPNLSEHEDRASLVLAEYEGRARFEVNYVACPTCGVHDSVMVALRFRGVEQSGAPRLSPCRACGATLFPVP